MDVNVFAPDLDELSLHAAGPSGDEVFRRQVALHKTDGGRWTGSIDANVGDHYWLSTADGETLIDPDAAGVTRVRLADGSSMWRCVVVGEWPVRPPLVARADQPVVYELHVKGFGGSFSGVIEHLDHLVALGVDVIELMPVHPFDTTDNYWGYMPVVWGAVHDQYGTVEELADLVTAAHDRGIEVWLDVVFNHTGEGDATMPTLSLRGLANETSYRFRDRDARAGAYADDSGCGNDINPSDPEIRRLILVALDRFADLGVDGFRFDLASLLTRDDGGLVAAITEWGTRRNRRLVAEPWDLGAYQVGDPRWPSAWLQWNDRFRDDVRGFVRGEAGLVEAMVDRVTGSPKLLDGRNVSLNFVTAHDGLTMFDLVSTSSDRHRSWDAGALLHVQQMKNIFAVLLTSVGSPMWVMGDEFGRTQHGHDNPYNVDGPVSWVDWERRDEWLELECFVAELVGLRGVHPPRHDDMRCFGADGPVDTSFESRSLGWTSNGLAVFYNAWWEPLTVTLPAALGEWSLVLSSAVGASKARVTANVPPRSVIVLRAPLPPA